MTAHYEDGPVQVWHGDCIDVMRGMPDASVDAVVTDPPYGLEFMGKAWDSFVGRTPDPEGPRLPREHPPSRCDSERQSRSADHSLPTPTARAVPSLVRGMGDRGIPAPQTRRTPPRLRRHPHLPPPHRRHRRRRIRNPRQHRLALRLRLPQIPRRVQSHRQAQRRRQFRTASPSAAPRTPRSADQPRRSREALRRPAPKGEHYDVSATGNSTRVPTPRTGRSSATSSTSRLGPTTSRIEAEREVGTGCTPQDSQPAHPASGDFGLGKERRDGIPATADAARWNGWGTALKPAFEPIVVARKPLTGTVAANVLAYGTGALNIDGSRIGTERPGAPATSTHGGDVDHRARPRLRHVLRGEPR
jgi:hypothetical protein